jgi:hypothetical protein
VTLSGRYAREYIKEVWPATWRAVFCLLDEVVPLVE